MRIIRPADYPFLYEMALDPASGFRWRFRATHPGYEEFVQTFRQGVFLNFIVEDLEKRTSLGYICCYRHDFLNQHAYIAVQGSNDAQYKAILTEASHLFIHYIFACFDFNKLYLECPEYNISDVKSALRHVFDEEAVFRSHQRFLGRWWNLHVLSVRRDTWFGWNTSVSERRLAALAASNALDETARLEGDEFIEYIRRELEVEQGIELSMESGLRDHLSLDSIDYFVLISAIEDLGVELDERKIAAAVTLRDVYVHYLNASEKRVQNPIIQ
jgi:RimJ/RimL family protein N-acetyltransferase/acyl carrier protein